MARQDGLSSALLARRITRRDSKFVACWRLIEARDGGIALDSLLSKQDLDESRAEAPATVMRTRE